MIPADEGLRRLGFEALVLRALYIVLKATMKGPLLTDWRADAIGYLDEHGNQSDGAKQLRRDKMPL
jgi:hypothetical protein